MPEQKPKKRNQLSRRGFLKAAGLLTVAAGAAAACEPAAETPNPVPTSMPVQIQYPEVPAAPATPPPADILMVFTPDEAKTVEALTARIMPGTPDDPGAREAGVVNFIDKMLAFDDGFAEPTYRQPPFAQTYEGKTPPAATEQPGQYQTVMVQKSELPRYGFQSILTPRESYRAGIAAVDRYANDKFHKNYADLPEDQQDQIMADLANDKATGFTKPSAKDFFKMLRDDTINGMFSDPAYGGNKDMVGWKLIGYPGAQRAYTPVDLKTEGHVRPPQSLAMLHEFHPGQPANSDVVLPVAGSDQHRPAGQVPQADQPR